MQSNLFWITRFPTSCSWTMLAERKTHEYPRSKHIRLLIQCITRCDAANQAACNRVDQSLLQRHQNSHTVRFIVLDARIAAVVTGNLAYQRQSQSRAGGLGVAPALEWFEYCFGLGAWDAAAVVAHAQSGVPGLPGDRHVYRQHAMPQGVVHQIAEQTTQQCGIAVHNNGLAAYAAAFVARAFFGSKRQQIHFLAYFGLGKCIEPAA